MAPAFLMRQMELRESLAEAESPADVTQLLHQAEALTGQCREALGQAFDDHDFAKAAHLVVRLKYLTKLVEDAKARKSRLTRLP